MVLFLDWHLVTVEAIEVWQTHCHDKETCWRQSDYLVVVRLSGWKRLFNHLGLKSNGLGVLLTHLWLLQEAFTDVTVDCDARSHVRLWIQLLLLIDVSSSPSISSFQLCRCCCWHQMLFACACVCACVHSREGILKWEHRLLMKCYIRLLRFRRD